MTKSLMNICKRAALVALLIAAVVGADPTLAAGASRAGQQAQVTAQWAQ